MTTVPGGAGPRGAPGAVQVVLVVVRRVEVHDQVDVVDVDAAGGDVGGDQHRHRAGGERVQGAGRWPAGPVAVDGAGAGRRPRRAAWPAGRRRAWCARTAGSGPGGRRSRRRRRPSPRCDDAERGGPSRRGRDVGRRDRVRDRVGAGSGAPACRPRRRGWPRTAAAARRRGVRSSSRLTSGRKPMSAMWSASSSTAISIASSEHAPGSIRSISRPGRGDDDVDAAPSAGSAGRARRRRRRPRRRRPSTSAERLELVADLHGQLPGRAPAPARAGRRAAAACAPAAARTSSGRPKARVLPEPVWAAAEDVAAGEAVGQGAGLDREGAW